MFLKIFIGISLILHQSHAHFKKCCPVGEFVIINSFLATDLSPHPIYSCAETLNSAINNSTSGKTSIESKNNENPQHREFIAFNTLADDQSHWPNCGSKGLMSKSMLNESMKVNSISSCVDILDNSYYVFTCNEKIEMARDEIYVLKKCCPFGMSYDVFTRMCVANDVSDLNNIFRDILNENIVLFEHDRMICDDNDVLVEYHSNVHDLKIFEGSLIIANDKGYESKAFNKHNYCIEGTLNSVAERKEGMTSDHFNKKNSSKWIAKVCRHIKVCKDIPCISKCCRLQKKMVLTNESSVCELHNQEIDTKFHTFSVTNINAEKNPLEPKEFGIVMSKDCSVSMLQPEEIYFISGVDGSLYIKNESKIYDNNRYCVENTINKMFDESDDELRLTAFVCPDDEPQPEETLRFRVTATLLAISAFFLFITLLVYVSLPKLLNLHGKTVVCHVFSFFVGYAFLSAVQFSTEVNKKLCVLIAFIMYFGFLSAFSWMNVMCLDIYLAFGSIHVSPNIRKSKEMKRFLLYSLYGWGFPLLMSMLTMLMNFSDVLPENYRPKLGESKCWFKEHASPAHLIFFSFPVGIQISVNIILFIFTTIHYNSVKKEIHRMQKNDSNEKQKKKIFLADKAIFMMNIKLFCIMGISWLFEIISSMAHPTAWWWYIPDAFNCLRGVMVFLIFAFKKKVYVEFRKKLGYEVESTTSRYKSTTASEKSTRNSASFKRESQKLMTRNSDIELLSKTNSKTN